MIAAPILWDVSVIGLIEVFSSEAQAFASEAELVLSRLAEITAQAVHRAGTPEPGLQPKWIIRVGGVAEEELPHMSPVSPTERPRRRNIFLLAAALTIVLVIVWLIGTWGSNGNRSPSSPSSQSNASPASPSASPAVVESVQSLRHLANQGDATAQFAMGARYATGEDVPQDYGEAVHWFLKAAEQGQVGAQATLGAYYWAGRGVPADLTQAYFWSFLAEAGGDEASRSRVALLTSRLSRGQILAAQRQANEWYRRHQISANNPRDTQ